VTVIGRTTVRIGSGGSDPEKEIVVHAGEKLKIPCRSVYCLFAIKIKTKLFYVLPIQNLELPT
jgi:hypothetical protein